MSTPTPTPTPAPVATAAPTAGMKLSFKNTTNYSISMGPYSTSNGDIAPAINIAKGASKEFALTVGLDKDIPIKFSTNFGGRTGSIKFSANAITFSLGKASSDNYETIQATINGSNFGRNPIADGAIYTITGGNISTATGAVLDLNLIFRQIPAAAWPINVTVVNSTCWDINLQDNNLQFSGPLSVVKPFQATPYTLAAGKTAQACRQLTLDDAAINSANLTWGMNIPQTDDQTITVPIAGGIAYGVKGITKIQQGGFTSLASYITMTLDFEGGSFSQKDNSGWYSQAPVAAATGVIPDAWKSLPTGFRNAVLTFTNQAAAPCNFWPTSVQVFNNLRQTVIINPETIIGTSTPTKTPIVVFDPAQSTLAGVQSSDQGSQIQSNPNPAVPITPNPSGQLQFVVKGINAGSQGRQYDLKPIISYDRLNGVSVDMGVWDIDTATRDLFTMTVVLTDLVTQENLATLVFDSKNSSNYNFQVLNANAKLLLVNGFSATISFDYPTSSNRPQNVVLYEAVPAVVQEEVKVVKSKYEKSSSTRVGLKITGADSTKYDFQYSN